MKTIKILTICVLIGFSCGIVYDLINNRFLKPDYSLKLKEDVITLTNNRTDKVYYIPSDTKNFGEAIQKAIEIDNL